VVAGVEMEGYGVVRGGGDAVRRVDVGVTADRDVVICGCGDGDESEEGE